MTEWSWITLKSNLLNDSEWPPQSISNSTTQSGARNVLSAAACAADMKPPLTMWQSPQLSYIHTGAWCQYRMYTSSQRHHWPAFALKTSKIIQQSHRILSEKGRRPNRLAGKGRKVWYIRQLVPVFRMHPNFLHQLCYASYALFQSCSYLFSHSKSFQCASSCPALLWCAALYIGDVLQRPRHPVAHVPASPMPYTILTQIPTYRLHTKSHSTVHSWVSLIKSFLQCFINSTRFSSSQCTASVQTLKYSHDKLRVQTATQRTASERMKPKLISIQTILQNYKLIYMTCLWRGTTSWMPWSHIPAIHPAPEERKPPVTARINEAHPNALWNEKRNMDGKGW